MYCQKCGQRLGDAAGFCSRCGSPVRGAAPAVTPSFNVNPRSKNKTTIIIIIAAIVIVVVGAGLGLWFGLNGGSSAENTSIVGTWVADSGTEEFFGSDYDSVKIIYHDDETCDAYFKYSDQEIHESGPYSIKGDELTTEDVLDTGTLECRYEISGNKLTLIYEADRDYKIVFERQ